MENTILNKEKFLEKWIDFPGFDGYQVSNYGNVRKWKNYKKHYRLLKPYPDISGYMVVNFTVNYVRTKFFIHRLVAIAFIENKNNYKEVNHINGIKNDNRVNNLEWCTRSHNIKEAIRLGLKKGITVRDSKGRIAKGNQS